VLIYLIMYLEDFSVMFLIVLLLIDVIVLNVHAVLFVVQRYLLVPLSLGVLLSQCILYVYQLTFMPALAYLDNKIQFNSVISPCSCLWNSIVFNLYWSTSTSHYFTYSVELIALKSPPSEPSSYLFSKQIAIHLYIVLFLCGFYSPIEFFRPFISGIEQALLSYHSSLSHSRQFYFICTTFVLLNKWMNYILTC